MLFIIDQSIADLFESGDATRQDIESLDNLVLGAVEGSHRIIGSRRPLQVLCSQTSLQSRTQEALRRAFDRVAREGSLHKQLSCYGRIVAQATCAVSSTSANGQRILTLPLRWFDLSAKIQPTTLLGEDLSDVEVWKIVGEVGAQLVKLPFLPIRVTPANGGGSQTGPNLAAIIPRGQLCLCIVDSDRRAPNGTMGGTAQGVQPYKNLTSYPHIEVAETCGRDLENMLPSRFYLDTYGADRRRETMHSLLEGMNSLGEQDVCFHIDTENGLHLRMLFRHEAGTIERDFWDAKLPVVMDYIGTSLTAFPCASTGTCTQPSNRSCSCQVVLGNPTDILDAFIKWAASKDRYKVADLLDSSLRTEWLRLGLLVASWCLGDDRLRG